MSKYLTLPGNYQIEVPYEINNEIPESELKEILAIAEKQSEWAWTDVMTGFKELGLDPSLSEKERIMDQLMRKKVRGLVFTKYVKPNKGYNNG